MANTRDDWDKITYWVNTDGNRMSGYTILVTTDLILDGFGCLGIFSGSINGQKPDGTSSTLTIKDGSSAASPLIYLFEGSANNSSVPEISNLKIDGSLENGLIQKATGYFNLTNCVNAASITNTGDQLNIGGLIAELENSNVSINDCGNLGKIDCTPSNVGGIIGIAVESILRIRRCYNDNEVKGQSNVGGLIGVIESSEVEIEACYNVGAIIANTKFVGGLIGSIVKTDLESSSNPLVEVKYCYNGGNINPGDFSSGIVASFNSGELTLSKCVNFGSVTVAASGQNIGGIVGYAHDTTSENFYANALFTFNNGAAGHNCAAVNGVTTSSTCNEYSLSSGTPTASIGAIVYGSPSTDVLSILKQGGPQNGFSLWKKIDSTSTTAGGTSLSLYTNHPYFIFQ